MTRCRQCRVVFVGLVDAGGGLVGAAEGARGDGEAAAAALRRSEDAYGLHLAVFLPELELARAWERAAVGQTTAAQKHVVRAAQIAQHSGMHAVEMCCAAHRGPVR